MGMFFFCSGMLVQDPNKGNPNDVDAIFNQAKELGAVEGPLEHLRPSSSSRSFAGTGRLLSGETVPSAPQQPEPVVHNIVFWTNGFTVNDGPLRRLDDPENASFLEVRALTSHFYVQIQNTREKRDYIFLLEVDNFFISTFL